MPDFNLAAMLQPVPRRARFAMGGWYVWCGTMCRADDRYFLLFSRWPQASEFRGWVTHSEIGWAVSDDPLGPFTFGGMALPGAGGDAWDAHATHNPAVMAFGGKFYLYYMGDRGNGEFWDHRNNQRIGVAVADHPAGPWQRFDRPLVDVDKQSWVYMMCSNPTVTPTPAGRFLMIYKTTSQGPLPFGGNVYHAAAFSDDPLGPFTRLPDPIFTREGVQFPAEDPSVFWLEDRYYVVCKDMQGCFTEYGPGLVLFESREGKDWALAKHPFVSARQIVWEDGEVLPVALLDRPQVYLEADQPRVLVCAVKPQDETALTYNVQIPLG